MNRVCKLLNIEWPIIQAGMVWVSGGKLAGASAAAGILGTVGAGSMKPDLLCEHIRTAVRGNAGSTERLAVNIPLLYRDAESQVRVALDEGIRIFITSAGSPRKFTKLLKDQGACVIHVVSSPLLAKKCEDAGVDMVVAEGFEAGGHNGRDELTTMVLVPQVVDAVEIPVVAAGGVGDGRGIAAALALGAEGVQMGTRFIATQESSAHKNFVTKLLEAGHDATMLCMKRVVPVRLVRNQFFDQVSDLEKRCASEADLTDLLGKGRARMGMLEGDLEAGELEAGQICALVQDVPSVSELVTRLVRETQAVQQSSTGFGK